MQGDADRPDPSKPRAGHRSLTPTARSGARWQLLAQGVETGLAAATILLLARLVTPGDYGIVALLAAIAGIVITVTASPVGSAIVVKKLVDRDASSTAWWVAVVPPALLFALLAAVALAIGSRGQVFAATLVVGASMPIQAAAIVVIGVLQQRLDFRGLATARIGAAVVGNGAALVVAGVASGFAGLLARTLLVPLAQFLACSLVARWSPAMSLAREHARTIVRYVRGIAGFGAMNQLMRRGDDVIIGTVLGSTSLGYYSISYRFIELPISQAAQAGSNVALPLLSLMDDQHRFRSAFLRTQKVLVWAVAPIGVCSLFLGDIAVTTILGEKWRAAGPIVQVFGAVGLIQAATSQVGSIYLARDATGLMFKWGLAVAPAFIVSVLVGLPWGPLGVAWSYLALNLILFYPLWAVPGPLVGLTPWMVVTSLAVELGWALAVAGGGGIVRAAVDLHGLGSIVIASTVATCVYWAGALAFDRTLRRDALGVLQRRRAAAEAEAVGVHPVSGPAR